MSLLNHLVLKHHQVHQNVADGCHGVLGVDHLKLGIVNDVERFSNVSIILSFCLRIEK